MLAPPAHGPRTRRRDARLPGAGRARAPTRFVPPRRRLCWGRSPSGSRERHQLRQLLQTHFMVSLRPGSWLLLRRGRGRGWKEPLRGGESSSGPSLARTAPGPAARPSPRGARPAAQPAGPHQCQHGQLVTPGRRAVPSRPPGSLGAQGLPRPSGKQRRQKLPRAAPRGEAAWIRAHRPYLALERPRSRRAARGAWCASARAWGGR